MPENPLTGSGTKTVNYQWTLWMSWEAGAQGGTSMGKHGWKVMFVRRQQGHRMAFSYNNPLIGFNQNQPLSSKGRADNAAFIKPLNYAWVSGVMRGTDRARGTGGRITLIINSVWSFLPSGQPQPLGPGNAHDPVKVPHSDLGHGPHTSRWASKIMFAQSIAHKEHTNNTLPDFYISEYVMCGMGDISEGDSHGSIATIKEDIRKYNPPIPAYHDIPGVHMIVSRIPLIAW